MKISINFCFCIALALFSFTLSAAVTNNDRWSSDRSQHCHNICQKRLTSYQKCAGCGDAYYCGRECQIAAWSFHKTWCQRSRELAKIQTLDGERLDAEYTRQAIEQESFQIFEKVYKGSYGLLATTFYKDHFHDQLASNNMVAAALLYQSLHQPKVREIMHLGQDCVLLLPGIGYLSSLESQAIVHATCAAQIFGFDIDPEAIELTRKTNPSFSHTIDVADGLDDLTWSRYSSSGIDAILFLHPLFCEQIDKTKKINSLGQMMLSKVGVHLPGCAVIILCKSFSEFNAISHELKQLNFEITGAIDNKDKAFPCYGFSHNIISCLHSQENMIFDRSTKIASILTEFVHTNSDKLININRFGEERYRFIILAKSPGTLHRK